MKIKKSLSRRIFEVFNIIIMIAVIVATLYPFLYLFVASISDREYVLKGSYSLIPLKPTLHAYKYILNYDTFWTGYLNTTIYTILGTFINLLFTVTGSYSLAQERFMGRKFFMFMITFSMLFSGGMIPTYLVVSKLGLLNTVWAMVLPGAISTWNFIIMRTFFIQLPKELLEASMIDGANETQRLVRIVIPISLPSIATIGLFYAVAHWNSYFSALLYLTDDKLYPVQIVVRQLIIENAMQEIVSMNEMDTTGMISESIKYAVLIASALPMIIVYPFIQKFFVKGVLVGSVKG